MPSASDRARRIAGGHSDPTHRLLGGLGILIVEQLERIADCAEVLADHPEQVGDRAVDGVQATAHETADRLFEAADWLLAQAAKVSSLEPELQAAAFRELDWHVLRTAADAFRDVRASRCTPIVLLM